jgi:hypothetical protein
LAPPRAPAPPGPRPTPSPRAPAAAPAGFPSTNAQVGQTAGLLAAGACPAPARPGVASNNPAVDMGGVKLGMTIAQVRQVLTCQASPYKLRDDRGSVRIGRASYEHKKIVAVRGTNLAMRGGPASDELTISFAGAMGGETVMGVTQKIGYPDDALANFDTLWARLDSAYGRFQNGLTFADKDEAAIVNDFRGARMPYNAYSYRLCAGFGTSQGLGYLDTNMTPPTDCGLIFSHRITYEINDPTKVKFVTLGTTDYQRAARAVYAGLALPPPYLGPRKEGALPPPLPLPKADAPPKIEPNPPRVCYKLQIGMGMCGDRALTCTRACVFGGPPERGACRSQCATNRMACEADARNRAAVSTCPQ